MKDLERKGKDQQKESQRENEQNGCNMPCIFFLYLKKRAIEVDNGDEFLEIKGMEKIHDPEVEAVGLGLAKWEFEHTKKIHGKLRCQNLIEGGSCKSRWWFLLQTNDFMPSICLFQDCDPGFEYSGTSGEEKLMLTERDFLLYLGEVKE